MAQETINRISSAITAGTPVVRTFRNQYPDAPHPYRKALVIYNRSAVGIAVRINGDPGREVRVSSGDSATRDVDEEIYFYAVDALTGATAGNDVDVYEYGGLDVA